MYLYERCSGSTIIECKGYTKGSFMSQYCDAINNNSSVISNNSMKVADNTAVLNHLMDEIRKLKHDMVVLAKTMRDSNYEYKRFTRMMERAEILFEEDVKKEDEEVKK